MRVKRIVFINRAPFGNLDLDLSDKNVISLTGINGSGKTTILSYIVDALYEIAKELFYNEFSGLKKDKFYRIISSIDNTIGNEYSLVYIVFDADGEDITYADFDGISSEDIFNTLMMDLCKNSDSKTWPIKYSEISVKLKNGNNSIKFIRTNRDNARKIFQNNILTYFPSYRYEQPGYLNDVYQMKLLYKCTSDFEGYLINPIEVATDLPEVINWMMDVVLDCEMYEKRDEDTSAKSIKSNLDDLMSKILYNKFNNQVKIWIGTRNYGGARIQIVDAVSEETLYPTIFNISAGESSLLCLFGELMKQSDKIHKEIFEVNGIVIIDEVDKHLHIKLQKEVLPTLIKMFPKIQFILSTHSPFVNMGLHDELGDSCSILNLDNGCRQCGPNENVVFRQAYDVMIRENERCVDLCNELKEQLNNASKPKVYLEGETDERYFKKTLEVYGYNDVNFEFKWIGHAREAGKVEFSGDKSMNSAISFFKANKPSTQQIFLFDSDTNKQEFDDGNIIVMCMQKYENHKNMDKGIENALVLDDLDCEQFYDKHEAKKDYGGKVVTIELNKMKMCDNICSLDVDLQKKIFANLRTAIDRIIGKLNENSKNGK